MTVTEHAEQFESSWMRWAGFDGGNLAIEALEECISRLTERAQVAIRMRYGKEATREVIAKTLEITEHGAKNLLQRAKGQLRDCVDKKIQGAQ